ncbi:MAG: aminopeptidase [Candidatus Thermoplasmatota archaeon]|nr:aminopeptidase [Candidatus Thermoplasmatota archaeon]
MARMVKEKDPHSWKRKWSRESVELPGDLSKLAGSYKQFLDDCRTERECARSMADRLSGSGFIDLSRPTRAKPSPGRGFFLVNRNREIAFGMVGKRPLVQGTNLIAFHLDSPRLDLKPLPVDGDADTGLGFLRTHYYGGIKKYHWVNIPLSLRGTIHTTDDRIIDVGRDGWTLIIPDLEPHLSKKAQDTRKLMNGITGEELIALAAQGVVDPDSDRPPVTKLILELLNEKYGIGEEDLISSDLCLVPDLPSRDLGFDRSMIAAYGQDDRISGYTALEAVLEKGDPPERWALAVGFDKEEVGSDGPTGARSSFLELLIYRLLEWSGEGNKRKAMNAVLGGTFCISSDVKSGINPSFKGVQDPLNAARLGSGVTITKYTGSGGKYSANDASAEMVHKLRSHLNKENIAWQMQESGRVDEGGGGTVAKFLASRNMDVIDVGIPLLSMHSKYEVSSKADIYMAKMLFSSFLRRFTP